MPKSKPNGFMLFCKSRRIEFERRENRKLTLPELVKLAGPGWQVCLAYFLFFIFFLDFENVVSFINYYAIVDQRGRACFIQ